MKDLGKTIAKYRKEHKLNQSQLAKELENYDIYVKQNSISAWELGTATPNARQFLALCEILEIYDIYTDFIGQNPLNPFRNLNEKVFFVKHFSLKRASEFPVFVKGISLLSAGHSYASRRMRACSIR